MDLILEPTIPVKIEKMKQRVQWQHQSIVQRGIDQTSMVIDDGKEDSEEFSFMVIGDSGTTCQDGHHPQREIAKLMLQHRHECRFVLHTGDVIYTVGSREYYSSNFIEPYREFLRGGENPQNITYDNMVFDTPILTTLGNHDYYDVPLMYRVIMGPTLQLRRLLRYKDIEIGWHGSEQGDAYAKAFLDYLARFNQQQKLELHLDQHYTAKTNNGRCLRYQPGHFTRLPNRYYTFRYGGIDFFALDSNTINEPSPIPETPQGDIRRKALIQRRDEIDVQEQQILEEYDKLDLDNPEDAQKSDALEAILSQINEVKVDIEKQLASHDPNVDFEQLEWFKQRLIESWNSSEVRARIVYFHHPPYVTEASKWYQAQTLAVRRRLRWVFDQVAQSIGNLNGNRPIVDLILNGHAHCLEHLYTTDTGQADSHINCIVSGGSGHYPRRQRDTGPELMETFDYISGSPIRKVADSLLFIGRKGYESLERFAYSGIRIDVKAGNPVKFVVKPFVAERFGHQWNYPDIEPFVIG
ncbi:MAG: metallophosphoesterase [Richelia sp. RM2_1_2]|nr:metallophosphoesterase [Richelia sp. SM2_1_7]NJM18796.1 metallophosphoesterase [Richelia sp. SM1_7_0]NJN09977.1 metallophosphoesterase [Richelia sp. RM1_1_1]NJO30399.1 metallophosphoesterase [Richelia sp. SL_2_1]NJO62125.1 metallophosphoesterase [Richelia sp. RM2_1_2]